MELDDLKNTWQAYISQDQEHAQPLSEHLNKNKMNVSNTLSKLSSTTLYWWKFTKNVIILLFACLIFNVVLFFIFPERFQNLEHALPVFGMVALFGLVTLWTYYEQVKIFDIADAVNIKAALKNTKERFKRWYLLTTLIYVIVFPLIYFVVVKVVLQLFHVEFPLLTEVSISGALSVISLLGNHLYYKKTYFKWLHTLSKSLDELEEAK
ncbi:hypothetical protein [Catalinimonas niigatensis]|uniref:hypothetical protein n=1 Tax=Catalinimonas niigatensis TaxID=1397264 RepID=UPI002666349C|nr:hypothetical protein [Catalinimonas niigatensis]WPP53020.1 hypothetical protein PZB72_11600 [Catalinimonas niigatensis]